MSEQAEQLKARTMRFALAVCAVVRRFPRDEPGPTVARQLAKAATSIAANYRAACRARSRAEFIAKIGLVAEEADEAEFWLEFISRAGIVQAVELPALRKEADELTAIVSKTLGTARANARPCR